MKWEKLTLILSPIIIIFISMIFLKSNPNLSFVYDDSYITLQFAKNFFPKKGLTFDGTHYNLGATSPFHILLLATFNTIFHNLHFTAVFLGIVSFIGLFYALFFYSKILYNDWRFSLLVAFLAITTGWLYFDALSGMDTVLFMALMVFTFYLLERKSFFYSIPLAVSILTRPEGWFLFLAILSFLLLRVVLKRDIDIIKQILIPVLITILIVLPYLFSNLRNTGSLLPNTAMSKAFFFGEIGHSFKTKLEFFLSGLKLFYSNLVYPLFFIIFVFLFFAREIYRHFYLIIFLFLFYFSYLLLFPGSTAHYWCRYQHIFYPLLILIITEGFRNFLKYYGQRFMPIKNSRAEATNENSNSTATIGKLFNRLKGLTLSLFVLLLIVINQYISLINVRDSYRQSVKSTEESLINLANYFKELTPPDAVIATHDIGALGYFSERKINDLVGLVNPEMTQFYRKPGSNLPIPFAQRNILAYVKDKSNFLVIFDFFKLFLNINPDTLPDDFVFLGETSPVYGLGQKYRIYGVLK